jgi:ubiquitin
MQIFIKTLMGKQIPLEVEPTYTIERAKELISMSEGIPVDQQRFLFNGEELANEKKFVDYAVQKHSVISMSIRLRG